MSEPENTINRPADRITVTVNGVEQEIYMSAGLLRRLVGIASASRESALLAYSDPYLQSILLTEALTPKEIQGEARDAKTLDDYEMSIDEAEKLINFIVEHIVYFFMKAAQKVKTDLADQTGLLHQFAKSMQSQNGSQASPETKPSVGDTTAN